MFFSQKSDLLSHFVFALLSFFTLDPLHKNVSIKNVWWTCQGTENNESSSRYPSRKRKVILNRLEEFSLSYATMVYGVGVSKTMSQISVDHEMFFYGIGHDKEKYVSLEVRECIQTSCQLSKPLSSVFMNLGCKESKYKNELFMTRG